MSLPQGIPFRLTSGFVTDFNAYDDPETSTMPNYPRTTAQGNSVGWETGNAGGRNRNSGNPSELAGVGSTDVVSTDTFRIDLPATGSYKVRFAAGDASYSNAVAFDLYDTTTLLTSLTTGSTSGANKFKDATNTEYAAAAWRAGNTQVTETFASTILRVKNSTIVANQYMAYVSVDSAVVAPTPGVTDAMFPGDIPTVHLLSFINITE